jgi:drug/metabolite transporter (DMT)-like permease
MSPGHAMSASTRRPAPLGALVVLCFGVLCVSSAAIFIKLAEPEAAPLAIAAWRMVLASVCLAPLAAARRRRGPRLVELGVGRRHWRLLLAAGLALALHFALWITSLSLTSVASSVVLVTTSPLWVALAEPLLLKRPFRPALTFGVLLAFAGAATIAVGDHHSGQEALVGDLLALAGAVAAAGYFLIGRELRGHLDLVSYVAIVYTLAAATLVLACLLRGVPLGPYTPYTWLMLLLLALVPQVLGHSSFNWALGHLSATFVSATVLGEALGSTLLAWWILDQRPPSTTLLGGAMILTGLFAAGRAEAAALPPAP